jgi:hypothetical protein
VIASPALLEFPITMSSTQNICPKLLISERDHGNGSPEARAPSRMVLICRRVG